MRIQIASDLHLEFFADRFAGFRIISPHPDADVLVLAGDIHSGTRALDAFANWPVPVVYVMGNHEAYRCQINALVESLRRAAAGTNIHFLERDAVVINDVRFLGTTLWTDYLLPRFRRDTHCSRAEAVGDVDEAMAVASRYLADHSAIRCVNGRPFLPAVARQIHFGSRAWLGAQLHQASAGPTVVVTHHGPHPSSVHPRYEGDVLSAAFCSDLTELMGPAQLWIHGHVHDSFDYAANGTRVIANPRGYSCDYRYATGPEHLLEWENEAFDPQLIVDV